MVFHPYFKSVFGILVKNFWGVWPVVISECLYANSELYDFCNKANSKIVRKRRKNKTALEAIL